MAHWVRQGKLKSDVAIVHGGLDIVNQALVSSYTGGSTESCLLE